VWLALRFFLSFNVFLPCLASFAVGDTRPFVVLGLYETFWFPPLVPFFTVEEDRFDVFTPLFPFAAVVCSALYMLWKG